MLNIVIAQQLLDRARSNQKNNPHFLDTQAVLYYKKEQYTQAKSLLTTLLKQEPTDATIALHLAKTEYKLGNTAQAQALLARADKHAHAPHEQRTIVKLTKKWHTPPLQ